MPTPEHSNPDASFWGGIVAIGTLFGGAIAAFRKALTKGRPARLEGTTEFVTMVEFQEILRAHADEQTKQHERTGRAITDLINTFATHRNVEFAQHAVRLEVLEVGFREASDFKVQVFRKLDTLSRDHESFRIECLDLFAGLKARRVSRRSGD